MLNSGKVNFKTDNRTDLQNTIVELRDLGYSSIKVRKMLNIPGAKMKVDKDYCGHRKMHKYPKTKEKALQDFKYLLIDLALIHKVEISKLNDEFSNHIKFLEKCQSHGNDRYKNTRKVLELYRTTELSREKIAEKVGISQSTVSRILKKGESKWKNINY